MNELAPIPQLATQRRFPPDQNPAMVYLRSLSPGSRRTMRTALNLMAGYISNERHDAFTLDWGALRFQHTAAIRAALLAHYKPASANQRRAALRGVLKTAWQLGQMSTDDYHKAAAISSIRGESLPSGRAISQSEMRALFAECVKGKQPLGTRDAALLGVLYGVGLRRAEVVSLDVSDYLRTESALQIRHGKGNKESIAYLPRGAVANLERWLAVRGEEEGPLFYPILKSGRIVQRRFTQPALVSMLERRMIEAGLQHFSAHDLRRSYISELLEKDVDISTVQKMARHVIINTTAKYDRRGEREKKRAADLIHVPEGD